MRNSIKVLMDYTSYVDFILLLPYMMISYLFPLPHIVWNLIQRNVLRILNYWQLSSFKGGATIPGHGRPTSHIPELILNNFGTRLGRRTGRFLGSLFPHVRYYLCYIWKTIEANLLSYTGIFHCRSFRQSYIWFLGTRAWRSPGCHIPQPARFYIRKAPQIHI